MLSKKRKSPYRHKVRAHRRQGRPVRKYERGKGKKPAQPVGRRRRRVVGREHVSGAPRGPYSITLSYIDEASETLILDALNYLGVVNPALERRATLTGPWKMSMRRRK